MQPLKLSKSPNHVTALKDRTDTNNDDLIDLFQKPRYFQVHFQHIHETNHQLQDELAQLKDAVSKVDKKLDCLLALLIPSSDSLRH